MAVEQYRPKRDSFYIIYKSPNRFHVDQQFFGGGIKRLVGALENDEEYYVKKAVVWLKKNFKKGK
jgi:hypothetical protein